MLPLLVTFSLVLSFGLLAVYYLTSYTKQGDMEEKLSPFECGFEPLSQMRTPFSARFFILVVLFLIFDVEVALLFPILSMVGSMSTPIMGWALLIFLLVLLLGLFYEWAEGAIDWVSA